MPGFDGTGPMGMGPMTGGGRGWCNPYGPLFSGYAPRGYQWWRFPLPYGGFCPPYLGLGLPYRGFGYGMGMAWGRGGIGGRGMAWRRGWNRGFGPGWGW